MASTRPNILPNFILTPQQQNLLFRALTSNQPNGLNADQASVTPESLTTSPALDQRGTSLHESNGPSDSPFVDYDYDVGPDTSFDFEFGNDSQIDSQALMIGDFPGSSPEGSDGAKDTSKASSPDNESSDKRSHPDEDDEDDGENGAKRRDEGRVAKKPGRKPLTNEPSSKRKAQNRAAQRAFRERKEKHLKDLETKVEELEKTSSTTNNENHQLRARIEKLTVELEQYKKKLSVVSSRSRSSTGPSRNQATFGSAAIQNINDVSFQFEFPKFGMFAGSPHNPVSSVGANQTSPYPSPASGRSPNNQSSPLEQSKVGGSDNVSNSLRSPDRQPSKDSSFKYPDSFSNSYAVDGTGGNSGSRTSLDSAQFSINGANTGSPASSSNSNMGPSSSCGTSPEPFTQSPLGFKPLETLTTIGEEQPSLTSNNTSAFDNLGNFGSLDFTNFEWMSQQNDGQFNPQLFGDYREPQSNILAGAAFDDSFFNDALEADFSAPFNAPAISSPKPTKKDICAEIDARKETEDTIVTSPNGKLLTCNNIWEQLQGCPKVQAGDLDLDGLCSDLQKKAKCGGTGAVVDEKDFQAVMTKYLGGSCPKST